MINWLLRLAPPRMHLKRRRASKLVIGCATVIIICLLAANRGYRVECGPNRCVFEPAQFLPQGAATVSHQTGWLRSTGPSVSPPDGSPSGDANPHDSDPATGSLTTPLGAVEKLLPDLRRNRQRLEDYRDPARPALPP
jgi:hypothetical protein